MDDLQLLSHLIVMAGGEPAAAREAARGLLDAHQSLAQVLALPGDALLDCPHLGENAVAFLLLIPALIARYTAPPTTQADSVRPWGAAEIEAYLLPHFQDQSSERVCAFCLGPSFELLSATLLTQGGTTAVSCSVRRVLKLALTHHSRSVILAHNHPDGVAEFSKSDLLATSTVAYALSTVDVSLADHLLLAGNEVISLRGMVAAGAVLGSSFAPPPTWSQPPWSPPRITLDPWRLGELVFSKK